MGFQKNKIRIRNSKVDFSIVRFLGGLALKFTYSPIHAMNTETDEFRWFGQKFTWSLSHLLYAF